MYAAWYGRTEIVKILLEHGADDNLKNIYGFAYYNNLDLES